MHRFRKSHRHRLWACWGLPGNSAQRLATAATDCAGAAESGRQERGGLPRMLRRSLRSGAVAVEERSAVCQPEMRDVVF